MRLHRLEIEGFGPFLRRQTVDFDAFADDGVFLIGGRTGAGKSSILDAVCFGLYGSVPRYEKGEKRLRSDHCEPGDITEVVVDFSTVAGRFRVTRSPDYERPARRGGGLTKQASAVALDELVDGEWIGRAAREVDVGNELDGILQLNMQQFLQVILLAQGRFAKFLLADSKERQQLLRKLFGTGRFEDYQARFDERRRASEQALDAGQATVRARIETAEQLVVEHGLEATIAGEAPGAAAFAPGADAPAVEPARPESIGDRLHALERAKARAGYRAERRSEESAAAEGAHRAASAALVSAREQRQAQTERDRARAALAALDAEEERIAEDRRTLDGARAAEAIRHVLIAAERAAVAAASADQAAAGAAEEWRTIVEEDPAAPDGSVSEPLRDWAAARTRESGAWEQAAAHEARIAEHEAEVVAAEGAVASAEADAATLVAQRSALPDVIEQLTRERDELRRRAARLPDLETSVTAASVRVTGAQESVRLEAQRVAATREVADRESDAASAFARAADLRRRRDAGMAGELAEALEAGEPCGVCGSTEHPAPAAHADPVSVDDVARATEDRERAAEQVRVATAALSTLEAEAAAATARADGRTLEDAQAELAAVSAERADAADAGAAALDAERRRAEAQAEDAVLETALDAVALRRAEGAQALALARHTLETARAEVVAARGDFATVAQRLQHAALRIAAAHALATAIDDRAAKRETAALALDEQTAALADSPFEDPASASAALRTPAAQSAFDERLTAHAAERRKERAILLDLELRTLPDEVIDLTPLEAGEAEARTSWTTAVDAASRAGTAAGQLGSLLVSATAAHEQSSAAAEEHEILRSLADTLAGRGANTYRMNLETFVLAAELEQIVDAANLRLADMSAGRYALRHSDARAARGAASGLGIVVFDAFTGHTRPAQSLSGGETFLSSLALALGLAEVVTARAGGIRLDTLFIDEGFGSLDAETLEVALRTLDELRAGGRTVGVISHVEAMQEQIPAQLTVRTTPDGPSVIES
ncbi:SMC family ATPase [Microbacterium panaciterrae]|uniref:Nuclease SbcCD subunit C n=1 Tax=Microbacterium panaciterrae TaxID=985759 RepID=A0ABP8P0F3_9MICO